jgi:tryptophan synthase alpha chain
MAGFGIRNASQVDRLAPHADGVIVGTALLDCIAAGEDPVAFLRALRSGAQETS